MASKLTGRIVTSIKAYLLSNLGLHFSERQDNELLRKIEQAAIAFGYTDVLDFINWLLANKLTKNQTSTLASYLTIGETYFMREKKAFDFLEQIYLPGLIHKRFGAERKLRIWCAGCATGEEAYSLAILLFQSIPDYKSWDISILATDINPVFLEKAKKGVYTKWSFRNNSDEFIKKYFTAEGTKEFQVLPVIKEMVTFSLLNLSEDSYPSATNNTEAFDIIFCRNVLIYFSSEGAQAVSHRFYQTLVKGGVLVVSPVEMSSLISGKFNTIIYSGFTIYHKGSPLPELKPKAAFKPQTGKQAIRSRPTILNKNQAVIAPTQIGLKAFGKSFPEIKSKSDSNRQESSKENFVKATALYEQGAFAEAEKLLTNAQTDFSGSSALELLLLAKTKANIGKLKEAEEFCAKGLQIDKLNPNFHYLLATVMHELGNDEKAISSLKMSLYLNPDFVLAHFLMGTLSLKKGNQAAGNKAFKNALTSLSKYSAEDLLPESDGLTAGRFKAIINSIVK